MKVLNAGKFMGDKIRELASQQPELCDQSGKGFWPVPAMFPQLLAHTIHKLQEKITYLNLFGKYEEAKLLTEVRLGMLKVVFEGDLGEDHTRLFLDDHKGILGLDSAEYRKLPFYDFCKSVLEIENPIVLLGILTRNEEGSLEEAKALTETKLIGSGEFARIHVIEEEEHGRISAKIREALIQHSEFKEDFVKGLALHDLFYSSIIY